MDVVEIIEIVSGVLVLAVGGAVASVLLARRYALWMSAAAERAARARGQKG
jgi:hypothetical protein